MVQHNKIVRKMEKSEAEKVFIINIINDNYQNKPIIGANGIIEIPRLLRLDEKKIDTNAFKNIIKHL